MDEMLNAVNVQQRFIRPEHAVELLTEREAAAYFGVSLSGLRKWRARHCGPQYARLFRLIRYRRSDLDAFVQSRIVTDKTTGEK